MPHRSHGTDPAHTGEPPPTADPAAADPRADPARQSIDALIVGGGIAGLWLLNLLTARGYAALLVEGGQLGCGQTLASQGMIHGGLKYALAGRLTGASEAIAGMPERWAACLGGHGDVDLSGLEPLTDRYYMFAAASTLGQLTTFFASRALRGRIRRVVGAELPSELRHPDFHGVVYALRDFVLDTPQLLAALLQPVAGRAYRAALPTDAGELRLTASGVQLSLGGVPLTARRLILAAGAGTTALLDALGLDSPRMQCRPLHQVVVRAPDLGPLFAHCLTRIRRPEPRLTITSHHDGTGWLWYLGGQIATDGVDMTPAQLATHARAELEACLPWRDWSRATIDTLRIDRAEPLRPDGARPDEAFATAVGPGGNCIVGWPTKLSLAPDLGDRVLALLPPPAGGSVPSLALPAATVGRPPWER
jgi:glycine/D-amino acid oxidase-like deaminating enzyme